MSILGFSLVLAGCSGSSMKEQIHYADRAGVDILNDLQNGTGYAIVPMTAKERVCRSPPPDVLASMSDSGAISMFGDSAGNNESFSSVSLGGRSPEVLIVREVMYRLCELSANAQLSNAELMKLYEDTIGNITDMVKTVGAEAGFAGEGYSGEAATVVVPASQSAVTPDEPNNSSQSAVSPDESDDSSQD